MKIITTLILSLIITMTTNACNRSDYEHIKKNEQKPNHPALSEKGRFDLSKGSNGNPTVIRLSSGYDMPVVGLGTYSLHGDKCVNAIMSAIRLGYRKFDTASFYGNDEEVGNAIRQAIAEGLIKREDVFVTTKLYPNEFYRFFVDKHAYDERFIKMAKAMGFKDAENRRISSPLCTSFRKPVVSRI